MHPPDPLHNLCFRVTKPIQEGWVDSRVFKHLKLLVLTCQKCSALSVLVRIFGILYPASWFWKSCKGRTGDSIQEVATGQKNLTRSLPQQYGVFFLIFEPLVFRNKTSLNHSRRETEKGLVGIYSSPSPPPSGKSSHCSEYTISFILSNPLCILVSHLLCLLN